MALLPILHWPDWHLSRRCQSVSDITPEICNLAADMLKTMYAAHGRGLAAPQVGEMLRLFVMDADWKDGTPAPQVILNPDILWMSDSRTEGPEGCLSIAGIIVNVSRATKIRLSWKDLDGQPHDQMLTGFAAICVQHEFDHLDGIVTLKRLSAAARARAEAAYFA